MLNFTDFIFLLCILSQLIGTSLASVGDRSWVFFRCMDQCLVKKCSNMTNFNERQPFHRKLIGWSCEDECVYYCMWKTVVAFNKDGSQVPQFFGKWPFVRFWGLQEPASVIFSVLNFMCHFLIFKFRKTVPSSAPMYYVWHVGALVGFNAWFWSIVYHTKDTDFTEKMDYFCAFSMAMYSFFGMMCRFLGTKRIWPLVCIGCVQVLYYIYHIYYLGWIKFDYAYNMTANVCVGLIVLVGWLLWCVRFRRRCRYAWKCILFILVMNLLLLLEVLDFPPLVWTFDAHSLWHAGTSPLGILWYSFITDDCLYLDKLQHEGELPRVDEQASKKSA